ncbi:hypothetical protein [Chryseobacterium sp. RR2-3-20]|uniref:hypothetical protein n=1 Tax=Chryseobacterium sp. RR2-3-20 TaxID=2787626 RepID=UPI001AE0B7C3|nr:hypothetical protein [Chryseobacterium sp. RR2-3-20]
MTTTTLYQNGDTFEITYKIAETKEPNKNYIYIDDVLHEVISKIKTNEFNVTEMNENIWKGIRERTNYTVGN